MADRLLGNTPYGFGSGDAAGATPEGKGRLVGRRYRLVSPVGRGGMGMVWHAHDVLLDRDVAIKELILPYGLDQASTRIAHQRMLREARSAARLSHPGIVTVHDVVEEDGRPWIVMELVRAWSLEQAVQRNGPLPVVQAAEIGVRVLDALRHAHAAGILHRDIKPGNVLLTSDRVVLTDFGIAAVEGNVTITQTGLLMGSPAYIPPERLSGGQFTSASDLWSFGATLYAAVEGRAPYDGADPVAVLGAILTQQPARPSRAGALTTVIEGLLRKDPADRMSAAQVAELLEQVLRSHGSGTPNRPPAPPPVPLPGGSVPLHLMPPLEVTPGAVPSRIVETPSGPVRVPNDFPDEPRAPGDTPAGTPGGRAVNVPVPPWRLPSAEGPPSGPNGGHQRGYDALRVPTAGLSGGPLAAPAALSGDPFAPPAAFPFDPPAGFPGESPDGAVPGRPIGGGGTALPASSPQSRTGGDMRQAAHEPGLAAASATGPATGPAAAHTTGPATGPAEPPSPGRRSTRRRATGARTRDGRPDPRLLALGGGGVLAVVAAVLFVLLPGGAHDPAVGAGAAVAAPAPADEPERSEETGEVPAGFVLRTSGGVSAAVPDDWTVKRTGRTSVVFSGPKNSGQRISVVEVPVTDPMAGIAKADRKGLDGYSEIEVIPVDYRNWKAADWEYTYDQANGVPVHALTRYVAVNGQTAYLITLRAQDLDWGKITDVRETFFATFASAQ
ncbi:serine/threonine protein kinase [Streptosporangium becharense]|uniref:non-specific serine/threonine protein kinase n=1 Tax=Streptosporangium becharense TaxID=1816182 RepID=A0A7W9MIP9_9ACTN|nr:serine/threonine-protein kinase [Streptosporangium becharense]MBB2911750.1 serine/threonine protein kinase [Streptosporangium becharense]MBB5822432.1 serine/threonine protein kinase [Streptosporangium becharense]